MDASSYLGGTCSMTSTGAANSQFLLLFQTIVQAQCAISSEGVWPADDAKTALANSPLEYDFIVAGLGSGGSVVCNRLSEVAEWKVLCLEAGGNPPIESEVPLLFITMLNSNVSWNRFVEATNMSSRSITTGNFWPSGKMLGGTGSINGMLYFRGNPADYETWVKSGATGWDYRTTLRYYLKAENMTYPPLRTSKYHSTTGPLKVGSYNTNDPLRDVLLNAAKERGWAILPDMNADKYVGFGAAQGTIFEGKRFSPAKAYLVPIDKRPNAHIVKNALVTKVETDDAKKTQGVRFSIENPDGTRQEYFAKSKKEVIVSANSIGTPQLLQLSGVGPADLLKQFNIPVKANLPVGENLQDHLFVPVYLKNFQSTAPDLNLVALASAWYQYVTSISGPFSTLGVTDINGFINTKSQSALYPEIQYVFIKFDKQDPGLVGLIDRFFYDDNARSTVLTANNEAPVLLVCVTLLNPKSRGKVSIRSTSPFDFPKIESGYLTEQDDVKKVVGGIKEILSFMNTTAFKKAEVEDVRFKFSRCPEQYGTDAYWECYARELTTTLYHPAGTAKMGAEKDAATVVTPRAKVKGIEGLRVSDASVIPTMPSGNTNAPVIMIGEYISDMIKQDWGIKIGA